MVAVGATVCVGVSVAAAVGDGVGVSAGAAPPIGMSQVTGPVSRTRKVSCWSSAVRLDMSVRPGK